MLNENMKLASQLLTMKQEEFTPVTLIITINIGFTFSPISANDTL